MKDLVNNLTIEKLTISTAESFTGGEFAARVVKISGASKVFKGALVAYQDEIKINLLNVSESIIKNHGAVSKECAEAMATNIKNMTNSDIGLSFTGNAGPTSSEGKPVGLIYIGLCYKTKCCAFEYIFNGSREEVIEEAIKKAKEHILNWTKEN